METSGNSAESGKKKTSYKTIGVVLVHGIGRQKPGDHLTKFTESLQGAYPESDILSKSSDRIVLQIGDQKIHIYEAYWADKLSGEVVHHSFLREILLEIAWYPYFNRRAGLLDKNLYPSWLVALWTMILVPLSTLLYLGHWGATFLILPITVFKERKKRTAQDLAQNNSKKTSISAILKDVRGKANEGVEKAQNTILDRLMDEFIGDIFNYTASVEGRLSPEHPLYGVGPEIIDIFRNTAARALSEGCSELQIVSHSLGTIVTYHGLSHYSDGEDKNLDKLIHSSHNSSMKISRLYTIGSPLEKIRFFWPKLFLNDPIPPTILHRKKLIATAPTSSNQEMQFQWDNFYSAYDIISGQLKRFQSWTPIKNHDMPYLGGMATAHVRYESNSKFLSIVGKGLTGITRNIPMSAGRIIIQIITSSLEVLLVPFSLLVMVVSGILFIAGMGTLLGKIFGYPFRLLGIDPLADFIEAFFFWFILFGMTILQVWGGFSSAKSKIIKKSTSDSEEKTG
jgi:hypothetical protein